MKLWVAGKQDYPCFVDVVFFRAGISGQEESSMCFLGTEGFFSGRQSRLGFSDTLISFTTSSPVGVLFWFQVGGPLRFAMPCFRSAAVWHNNSGCSKAMISINERVGEMFIILPTVMFVYQILLPSVISVFSLLPKVVILNGGWRHIFKS